MLFMFYLIQKNVKKKFNNFDEKMQLLNSLNKIMLLCVGIYIENPLQKIHAKLGYSHKNLTSVTHQHNVIYTTLVVS